MAAVTTTAAPGVGTRSSIALLLLAVVAAYATSLANGFALDDTWIIESAARAHDPWNASEIWLTPYWPRGDAGAYRPFIIFAFALQWVAGDGAAWVFHAVSVALHGAATALVFLLLRTLVRQPAAALAGALVFAVHPVHVEAVANVVGQAELVATTAVLAACLLHARRPADRPFGVARHAGIAVLYLLAMLTKESAIVLPALLAVVDAAAGRIERGPRQLRAYVRSMAPVAAVSLLVVGVVFALRLRVLGEFFGSMPSPDLTFLREPAIRIPTALGAWVEYARLMFFPLELAPDYAPRRLGPETALSARVLVGAALFALTVLGATRIERRPGWGFPCAWFLVAILPVSNLLFPAGVIVAERTLYMPSVAVAAAVAYAWRAHVTTMAVRRLAIAALAVLGLLFTARTAVGNRVWRDSDSLLETMLTRHPEVYRGHWIAAGGAMERGDTAAADAYWAEAYRLWPGSVRMNLEYAGWALRRRQVALALRLAEEARAEIPDHYRPYQILAHGYFMKGMTLPAIEAANRAIALGGRNALMYEILGRAQERLGAADLSALAWRHSARLVDPENWPVWVDYSAAEARNARHAEAAAALDTAFTRAGPAAVHALCRYGMTLAPAAGDAWTGILQARCNLRQPGAGPEGGPARTSTR